MLPGFFHGKEDCTLEQDKVQTRIILHDPAIRESGTGSDPAARQSGSVSGTGEEPAIPADSPAEDTLPAVPLQEDDVPEDTLPAEPLQEDDVPEDTLPADSLQEDGRAEDTLPAAMEAILFAMGEAVPVDDLARALGISRERALELTAVLAERYRQKGSGLMLNWYDDAVQLSTKPDLYEYLIRIASEPKKPKLTPTLLETLSIIAFRQPVTRMEVEKIRGVNSDFAISRLVSFDLVQEVGRKEIPGRPLLFGTTEQFLRSFGIRSVEELPEPDPSQMELFREQAEEEVTSRLQI